MDKIVKAFVVLISLLFISSQFISYSFDFLTDQLAGINHFNNQVESKLVEARVTSELAVLEAEKDYKVSYSNAKSTFYQSIYFFGAILVIISVLCLVCYIVLHFLDKGHERIANMQERAPLVRLSVNSTRALIENEGVEAEGTTTKQLISNRGAYRVS